MTKKTFSGAGRKPRAGVPRAPSGRIADRARGEPPEKIMATATAAPHRRDAKDPRDPRLGYALGRAMIAGTITEPQFMAGERYTVIAVRYMRDITGSLPRFPAMNAEIAAKCASTPDLDPDIVQAIRDDWSAVQSALLDTGEHHAANRALAAICIMDRDLIGQGEIGALRVGLNALARMWRIGC